MIRAIRERKLRALGKRDGWRCRYCDAPLVPWGEEATYCTWRPPRVHYDHCGCGRHVPGERCEEPARWVLPEGWHWPTLDHVLARVHGGSDALDNLVLACGTCNSRKGARAA